MDGVKRVTAENWDHPDPAAAAFSTFNARAGPRQIEPTDLLEGFLAFRFKSAVPDAIADLFDVSRQAAVYGWLFYPIFAIADDHLHRAADLAVKIRVEQAGGNGELSLKARLDWLVYRGLLSAEESRRWGSVRQIRNLGAHPDFVTLRMPSDVKHSIEVLGELIDDLFARQAALPR